MSMNNPVLIPCRCEAGRECGKALTIAELANGMTVVTIGTRHGSKSIMLDAAGKRQLIDALEGL